MGKNVLSKKNIQVATYVVTLIFMFTICLSFFNDKEYNSVWDKDFGKNCEITTDTKVYHNADISNCTFTPIGENKKIEIRATLPTKFSGKSTFVIHSWHSTVEVFVGRDKIYSYGQNLYKNKDMLGSGYHFISILPYHSGKTITVKMVSTINNALRSIEFFKICKSTDVALYVFYPSGLTIAVSSFMIIFGLLGCICSVISSNIPVFSKHYMFYVFLTSFLSGVWLNCGCGFFHFISRNYEMGNFLEFASLYLIIFVYVLTVSKIQSSEIYDKYFKLMKIIYLSFLVIAFSCHFLRIMYLPKFLPVMHVITALILFIIFYIITRNYKSQKKYERVLLWGNAVSICLVLIQMVLFNLALYSVQIFNSLINKNFFVIIAALIIIISLFASYIVKMYEVRDYEREIEMLKKYAYKDNLTGLSNRESGTCFLHNVVKNNISYYLIMFDLNDLKKANDVYGHIRGDKLIKDFADCIDKAFPNKKCEKIRYGGDEFLVILREYKGKDVDVLIAKLKDLIIEKNNEVNDGVSISMAYGVARSDECKENDYKKVVELADKRMYLNKAEVKGKLPLSSIFKNA